MILHYLLGLNSYNSPCFGSGLKSNSASRRLCIQRAVGSDIDSIVKITRTKDNRKALPWVMKVVLNEAIEHPDKRILLVAKDKMKNVLGFIRLYCRKDNTVTLHEMAVADEFKGKGIGTKLIAEAEKIVRKHQAKSIKLKTPADLERIHKFYIKNGFKKIGEEFPAKRLLFVFKKQF